MHVKQVLGYIHLNEFYIQCTSEVRIYRHSSETTEGGLCTCEGSLICISTKCSYSTRDHGDARNTVTYILRQILTLATQPYIQFN